MRYLTLILITIAILVFLLINPFDLSFLKLGKDVIELDAYRGNASIRCSGGSYRKVLGTTGSSDLNISKKLPKKLFNKGFGTGSLQIGVTLSEKTELARLLGNLDSEQVERFLSRYESCMDKEMYDFYNVKGLTYPEKPKTTSVVWGNKTLTATVNKVANMTEKSGNWRSYDICVAIPVNGLMDKDTVSTKVIGGIPAGTWGDWRDDIQFVERNEYGPTKVCRGFDHQIHDQDRLLEISVNYKIPEL